MDMSKKKQSSIDLFAIALYEKGFLKGNGDDINDLLEEAKAMHKNEVMTAWYDGISGGQCGNSEEYYESSFVENFPL